MKTDVGHVVGNLDGKVENETMDKEYVNKAKQTKGDIPLARIGVGMSLDAKFSALKLFLVKFEWRYMHLSTVIKKRQNMKERGLWQNNIMKFCSM